MPREPGSRYFSGPFEREALIEMVREAMKSPCWDDGIQVLSGTPAWVSLAARCDIETANRLVQFLRGVRDPTIPDADREAIVASFREILLNALGHGGQFDPSHYVEISFIRSSRAVAMRVKILVKASRSKSFGMLPSTVRLAIFLATLPFAKRRALGRVASAFCSRKNKSTISSITRRATRRCSSNISIRLPRKLAVDVPHSRTYAGFFQKWMVGLAESNLHVPKTLAGGPP